MSVPTPTPRPPRHLTAASRRFWQSVVQAFTLEEHHIVVLLTPLCEALDRGRRARALLEQDGDVVTTKAGARRAHPAVRIAENAETIAARLLRELDLDFEGAAAEKRPPALRSVR